MNDHVMPSDVTFIVRRCARGMWHVACGNDVIIYDVGNLVLILVYIIGTPEVVCCVEVSTEPLSTCRMGLRISTKCLAVSVTQFSIHNVCTYIHTHS